MRKLSEYKNYKERNKGLEEELNIDLSNLNQIFIDDPKAVHCENLIGAVTVPLGIAGPVLIKNIDGKVNNYYIPLATTEGALIASVSRGCKAISFSGGANTNIHRVGTTRGPVFYTGSISKSQNFFQWIKDHQRDIAKMAEATSNHLKYKKSQVRTIGAYGYVRFYFDTDKAMGMNMATIATQAICNLIEEKTGASCISIAGNYDIDKKPSWLNFINNRGHKIWAEAIIDKKTIKQTLKTTADNIYDVWLSKCMIGSAMSGSLGFNCQYANIVAAFFAATGQDLAHVVEGSMGITTTKVMKEDLYISIHLPAVMLGIIGGGTNLVTQKQARSITKTNTIEEFGSVLAAGILAGELSLLASLAAKTLASSHKRLGR